MNEDSERTQASSMNAFTHPGRKSEMRKQNRTRESLAACQGLAYIFSSAWPLVHMRSFEAVTGPKTDTWLVRTVSGLLMTIGALQVRYRTSTEGLRFARSLGIGTAATLAAIDVWYACRGRISKIYLLDAAAQASMLAAWLKRPSKPRRHR